MNIIKVALVVSFILLAGSVGGCSGGGNTPDADNVNSPADDNSGGNNEASPNEETGNSVTFAETFGGKKTDGIYAVQQTSDGGYIVAGNTSSFGAGDDDAWVLKLDSKGAVEWQKAYGGLKAEGFYSIEQTTNGGYIVSGYTSLFSNGSDDVWVLKLDSSGNTEWQKNYGGSKTEAGWTSIRQTLDGGYIVAGSTASFGAGKFDAWALKLNSNGGVEWQKTYGGLDDDYFYSIQPTSDGGYIAAGSTTSFGGGWILKLNSNGGVEWQEVLGETAYSVQQVADGGYIVAGTDGNAWVSKLATNGEMEWQKRYVGSNSDKAFSVQQTSDKGYIVSGHTTSIVGNYYENVWVLKLKENGDADWQHTYGGLHKDGARWTAIKQTSDDGYILVSEFGSLDASVGVGDYDAWIIKMTPNGNVDFAPSSGASIATAQLTTFDGTGVIGKTTVSAMTTNVSPVDTNATTTETNATAVKQTP